MSLLTSKTTSTPTYTAPQQQMQDQVGTQLSQRLANPGAVFNPQKAQAIGGVNKTYAGLTDRLQASAAGRGFGRSGKTLTNQKQLEISRAGDMGTLNSQFAGMQTDYETNLLKQAQQFGFTNPGTTQTSNPGVGGLISGGLSAVTTLFGLNAMLKGFGGGATSAASAAPATVDYGNGAGSW